MKTDELIAALANDQPLAIDLDRRLGIGLIAGLAAAAVLFVVTLGVRSDLRQALTTWRFEVKMAIVLGAVVVGLATCRQAMRPSRASIQRLLWLLPAAVLAATTLELIASPSSEWVPRLIGANAVVCLTAIPLLALAPLAAFLLVMRDGAPASPARAGALAGLAAAAIGASLYGLHCFDDSPLFVATWYTLASLPIIAAGAAAGHRLLRW